MDYKLVGSSCAQHGQYTFYKAFEYTKNNKTNILAVSEFFFAKLWPDSDLISIGELQLLWTDKTSEQTLASLRLYILPENTPDGRLDIHGEDEVLAISEKVVLRVDDLLTWIHIPPDWHWGQKAVWTGDASPEIKKEIKEEPKDQDDEGSEEKIAVVKQEEEPEKETEKSDEDKSRDYHRPALSTDPPLYPTNSNVDMNDVLAEKNKLGLKHWEVTPGVVVLSYSRYCRYRGLLKRLEGVYNKWLRVRLIQALGGFTSPFKNTRVLFCKDTFDYPELEGHEMLCNHLAPKVKGKNSAKRRRKEMSASEESASDSDSSDSSDSSGSSTNSKPTPQVKAVGVKPRLRCTLEVGQRSLGNATNSLLNADNRATNLMDEKRFLHGLHNFMRARNTPISRIPVVGFKEVNLFKLYKKVIELGGYDVVTNNKMWKQVYQVTGGDMSCTSAATLSRRHYEKLLLPYERFLKRKASTLVIPSAYSLSNQSRIAQVGKSGVGGGVKLSSISIKSTVAGYIKGDVVIKSSGQVHIKSGSTLDKQRVTSSMGGDKGDIPERLRRQGSGEAAALPLTSSVTIIKKEATSSTPSSVQQTPQPDSTTHPSTKASVSIKPAAGSVVVKKQKLDMLKQCGLEVTPVAQGDDKPSQTQVSSPSSAVQHHPQAAPRKTEQQARAAPASHLNKNKQVSITVTPDISLLNSAPNDNKVSITVTPDMSHLMYPWRVMNMNNGGAGSSAGKHKNSSGGTGLYGPGTQHGQARGSGSTSAVGLPVEAVLGSGSAPIDLRTSKAKKGSGGAPGIGSNLEISLIPSGAKRPTINQPPGRGNSGSNASSRRNYNSANSNIRFNTPLYTLKSSPNSAPYVPLIDPAYLCGNIVTQKLPQFTAPNPATSSPASINSFYKDLLRSQGIFNLLPDGSTSISLVSGQSTPTSK